MFKMKSTENLSQALHLVFDLQGAQGLNARRGIGKYVLALADELVEQASAGLLFVTLLVNAALPETAFLLQKRYGAQRPGVRLKVWTSLKSGPSGHETKRLNSVILESVLESLDPDAYVVSSVFEGWGGGVDPVVPRARRFPVLAVVYDLIPLIHPNVYLTNSAYADWYMSSLARLMQVDGYLCISPSSASELQQHLDIPASCTHLIGADIDPAMKESFRRAALSRDGVRRPAQDKPYILYTGGIDHRKNIERLIEAQGMVAREMGSSSRNLRIVCSIHQDDRKRLGAHARACGLTDDAVVFTGYVDDEQLISLYLGAELFVFPSWHEGFGLPVLEAMHANIPTIGAQAPGVSDVIGWQDALFDPRSPKAIAASIRAGLDDPGFRTALIENGRRQREKHNWRSIVDAVIQACTTQTEAWGGRTRVAGGRGSKRSAVPRAEHGQNLRLAYVSPMPHEKTGVAQYSAELVPFLGKYYELDVICAHPDSEDIKTSSGYPRRSYEWFSKNYGSFDRIIYHVGNSEFHAPILKLMRNIPGVVVLHDFYLGGLLSYLQYAKGQGLVWNTEVLRSHGYGALLSLKQVDQPANPDADPAWTLPVSRFCFEWSLGVIVHSHTAMEWAKTWYGRLFEPKIKRITLLSRTRMRPSRLEARARLGLDPKELIVATFGVIGPMKCADELIEAWQVAAVQVRESCTLLFVGECSETGYGQRVRAKITNWNGNSDNRIRITGWVSDADYELYLASANVAVQLRTLSRGETSRAVLDCFDAGLPVICNACGPMAEIPAAVAVVLPERFTRDELAASVVRLVQHDEIRRAYSEQATALLKAEHGVYHCAQQFADAIESFHRSSSTQNMPWAKAKIDAGVRSGATTQLLSEYAATIAKNFRPTRGPNLLVDISELVQRDSKTGIQRVVRSLLKVLLLQPPEGFIVEPVYASAGDSYRYARTFTCQFLQAPAVDMADEQVEIQKGDIFLGLDLQPHVVVLQRAFYEAAAIAGAKIWFFVYDLLPMQMPQHFVPDAADHHEMWLSVVASVSHGLISISDATQSAILEWMQSRNMPFFNRPKLQTVKLAGAFENAVSSGGRPIDADTIVDWFKHHDVLLMVGTLEPRKRHDLAVGAIAELTRRTDKPALFIVGKQGWMVDGVVNQINLLAEATNRIYWRNDISDEFLEELYTKCKAVLVLSDGEGFGLPIVEAATRNVPVIARDIPVFREVGGTSTHYVKGESVSGLAAELEELLRRLPESQSIASSDEASTVAPCLSWQDVATQVCSIVIERPAAPQ